MMAINQVIYGGETLMDVTDSTVTKENLAEGAVAYNAAGERIVGELSPVLYTPQELTEEQKAQARANIGAMEAVTPQMFGAVGDGVADDTAAIFAAIASGYHRIVFPEGTYKITQAVTITAPVTFEGIGNAVLSFENDSVFNLECDSCHLKDLIIRSSTANWPSHILTINGACSVTNCELDGLEAITDGADVTATGGIGIFLMDNASGTVIKDCYIHNTRNSLIEGWHYRTHPVSALTDLLIENNVLFGSETSDALAITASDSIIRGNNISGKWQNCICLHADTGSNCERVVFENNTIDVDLAVQANWSSYAIALRPSDDGEYFCIDCKVVNNYFNGWGAANGNVYGVLVHTGSKNALVSGNSFRGNIPDNSACIGNYGDNTQICNNTVEIESGTHKRGIRLDAGSAIVSGNVIVSNGETDVGIKTIALSENVIEQNFVKVKGFAIEPKSNDVVRNNILYGERGLNLAPNVTNVKVQNNVITAEKFGVRLETTCANVVVDGNEITCGASNSTGILVAGSNHLVRNNIVNSGAVYPIMCANCSGDIVIFGNKVARPIYCNSAASYWIENNDLGGNLISLADVALTAFCINNRNYSEISNVASAKRVENGIAKQAASPTSSDAANVWGNQYDLVKKYDLVVEDTSATPYQRYVLRSNNVWEAVSNEAGGGGGDSDNTGVNLLTIATNSTKSYIAADGALVNSTSWQAFYLNANTLASIDRLSVWTNNLNFYAIAFYSSATPSANTFISGEKFTVANTAPSVFANISIPENAVLAVFASRTATSAEVEAIGTKLDTIYLKSPDGTKFMITVSNDGVLTATEVTA